jgi:transcription elongation factor Elf1
MKKMKAITAVELLDKYNTCPDCGNDKVGAGEGDVKIHDNVFTRSCKCGWMVKVTVEE